MEIRRVRPDEYEQAGAVTAEAYAALDPSASAYGDYLNRVADVRTRAAHALVLGAFEDGGPVATVTVELWDRIPGGHPRPRLAPGQAHIRMLGVAPAYQRRGVARRLMDAAIDQARRAGKRRVTLETTEAMVGAHRLYESMGFRRQDDLIFDDGFRLRTYELRL